MSGSSAGSRAPGAKYDLPCISDVPLRYDPVDGSPLFECIDKRRKIFAWTEPLHESFKEWWMLQKWYQTEWRAADREEKAKTFWMNSRRDSQIWAFFQQGAYRDTGRPVIVCKFCGVALSHPSGVQGNHSLLQRHVVEIESCKEAQVKLAAQRSRPGPLAYVQTADEINLDIAKLLTSLGAGFDGTKNPEFRRSLYAQGLHKGIPTPATLQSVADKWADRATVRTLLCLPTKSRVALLVDSWSMKGYNDWGVLVSFVDDTWTPRLALLDLVQSHPLDRDLRYASLTVETTASIIKKYNLEKRILAITADDTSLFPASHVKAEIEREGSKIDDILQIPCLSRVSQLVEGAFYTTLGVGRPLKGEWLLEMAEEEFQRWDSRPDANDSPGFVLFKLRLLAALVNTDAVCKALFEACQETSGDEERHGRTLRLVKDVPGRWSSTTVSLVRALQLRKSIDMFLHEWPKKRQVIRDEVERLVGRLSFSASTWEMVSYMVDVTKVIGPMTDVLEERETNNIHQVLSAVGALTLHLAKQQEALTKKVNRRVHTRPWFPAILSACTAAASKLNEYASRMKELGAIFEVAILLSPMVEGEADERFRAWGQAFLGTPDEEVAREHARKTLATRYTLYFNPDRLAPRAPAHREASVLSLFGSSGRQQQSSTPLEVMETELERFYLERRKPGESVFDWWRANHARFPQPALLARDTFAVLPTAAHIERLFGALGLNPKHGPSLRFQALFFTDGDVATALEPVGKRGGHQVDSFDMEENGLTEEEYRDELNSREDSMKRELATTHISDEGEDDNTDVVVVASPDDGPQEVEGGSPQEAEGGSPQRASQRSRKRRRIVKDEEDD